MGAGCVLPVAKVTGYNELKLDPVIQYWPLQYVGILVSFQRC